MPTKRATPTPAAPKRATRPAPPKRLTAERQAALESWWPILRDISCFVIGSALLFSQVVVKHPDATIVGAGLALIGVTGSGRIQEWARSRISDVFDDESDSSEEEGSA